MPPRVLTIAAIITVLAAATGCTSTQLPALVRTRVESGELVEITLPGHPKLGEDVRTAQFWVRTPFFHDMRAKPGASVLEATERQTSWSCSHSLRSLSDIDGSYFDTISCRLDDPTVDVSAGRSSSRRGDSVGAGVITPLGEYAAYLESGSEQLPVIGLRRRLTFVAIGELRGNGGRLPPPIVVLVREARRTRVFAPAAADMYRWRAAALILALTVNHYGWDLSRRVPERTTGRQKRAK